MFCFFEVLPHHPVGVSEVHLILGLLLLLYGHQSKHGAALHVSAGAAPSRILRLNNVDYLLRGLPAARELS